MAPILGKVGPEMAKPEPYVFHCTPCRRAHAGDCPRPAPAPAPERFAPCPGANWAQYLPAGPTQGSTDQWMRGVVYVARNPRTGTRMVFRALDLTPDPFSTGERWKIEVLANDGGLKDGEIVTIARLGGLGVNAQVLKP